MVSTGSNWAAVRPDKWARVPELVAFVAERREIFRRRKRGEPKPWTDDEILRNYRFGNLPCREDDKVTVWFRENWRGPNAVDPDLWFAFVVGRNVNEPEALQELGYPVPWDRDHFVRVMEDRRRRGERTENPAYRIPAGQVSQPKAIYLADSVFSPMWRDRANLREMVNGTLAAAHRMLTRYNGMGGGFIAAQVIADLKYVEPLRSAPDWWTWAASGPGSRRGLNRLLGRPVNEPWDEVTWLRAIQEMSAIIAPLFQKAKMAKIHNQDLQHCLCEWDKYQRAKLGEGKPKQRYPGLPDDKELSCEVK